MRAGGRHTALPRRVAGCVPTPKTLSPPRGGHRGQHAHAPRLAPRLHRTTRQPPARPGARAGRTGALARPASRGRRADTRTS
eukprot:1401068-Prymnesium_polylepis.1